jgi:hypothetical protein
MAADEEELKDRGREPTTRAPGRTSEAGRTAQGSYQQQGQQGQGQPYGQYGGWGWYYWPAYQTYQKPKPPRSSKPAIAGALMITAGLLTIIIGGFMGTFFLNIGPWNEDSFFNENNWESGIGGVQGHVIYQNASPVEGAVVTFVDTGQVAISNDTGFYRLIGLTSGWHDLKVEKEGHKTILQNVYINSQGNIGDYEWTDESTVDFQIQQGEGSLRIGTIHEENPDWEDFPLDRMVTMAYACIGVSMIFGAITVIGGYMAFKRTHFPFVVVSAILGIISMASIFCIIALIILFLCYNEFDAKKAKKGGRKGKRSGRGGGSGGHIGNPAGGFSNQGGPGPGPQGQYRMANHDPIQYGQRPHYIPQGPRTY